MGQGLTLYPGDSEYDAERVGWNTGLTQRPHMIMLAEEAADVALAMNYAATSNLPVAVQATGHGVSVPADGAVLVNTRKLNRVTVWPDRQTAVVAAGATWSEVIEAAAPHGLAPLCGSAPGVGAVGYLSGGGLPVLGRAFGYAADHVRAVDVVTPDGFVRRATPDRNTDLFWAVRGGTSNFGVITSAEIDLMPLRRFYGGGLFFTAETAADVLADYAKWTNEIPEELCTSVALMRYPDLDLLPPPLRGNFLLHLRIAYSGPEPDGRALLHRMRSHEPILDTVTDRPYTEIGEVHKDPTQPCAHHTRSALLSRLDDRAVAALLELAGPRVALPPGMVELRHLGGALARQPRFANPIGHRDAGFTLLVANVGAARELAPVQDRIVAGMAPWATGGLFPNFLLAADTDPRRVAAAYPTPDYRWLRRVKAAYDPRNTMRLNHNIPPEQ